MICPTCEIPTHQDGTLGGAKQTADVYESWTIQICPGCRERYMEYHTARALNLDRMLGNVVPHFEVHITGRFPEKNESRVIEMGVEGGVRTFKCTLCDLVYSEPKYGHSCTTLGGQIVVNP